MKPQKEPRLVIQALGSNQPPAELPRAGVLVIGSDPERSGLLLEDQGVAPVHCAIGKAKGGGWALKDLGSDFGTLVNGEKITSVRLRAGDRIVVGSRRLDVFDPEQPQATQVAKPAARMPKAAAQMPKAAAERPATSYKQVAVSGFRIGGALGRGGMGQVFLAVQESLDRQVALKVLSPALAGDAEFVRSFQAEARAAAALTHHNVVTVHDVGEADGLHYLTMEYMDRGSLEERLAGEGQLAWPEVLGILHDAASGLVYAESRGIVHRDIKPANLMQNHTGVTKIADLGLATREEAQDSATNGDRKIHGTPHFMSPEHARGERVDCRSDLYSLGATAYRLLSGHTPFEGDSSREILRALLLEEPQPLSELVDDLPAGVLQIVERLMQKEPGERYPSASALLLDVDALRAGASAPGTLVAAPAPAHGRGRRRGMWVAAAGLLIIVGAWLSTLGGDEGSGESSGGGSAANGQGNDPEPFDPTAYDPLDSNGLGGTLEGTLEDTGDSDPTPATSIDDDTQLKLRESQAKNAYLEIMMREIGLEERRDSLRGMAAEYGGTTSASEALNQADSLDAEILRGERAVAQAELRRNQMLNALRSAAMLDLEPPRPAIALQAMGDLVGQSELESDVTFVAQRQALRQLVVDKALEYARARLEAARTFEQRGDFDALRDELSGLAGAIDVPLPAPYPELERWSLLKETAQLARTKLADLPGLAERYVVHQAAAEAQRVAAAFAGSSGLEAELGTLDLKAAEERLRALEAELSEGPTRRFVHDLRTDLALAGTALDALIEAAGKNDWRRTSVIDPRKGYASVRNAVSADTQGILIEVPGGVEHLPWSAFGRKSSELHKLFHERLDREYTDEEEQGIAALLRLCAVTEAIDHAEEMFSERPGNFSQREARELMGSFEHSGRWGRLSETAERNLREREAAELLSSVLLDVQAASWSSAVAGTERLLESYADSLLVRLMSDGRPWRIEPRGSASGERGASGSGDESDPQPGGETDGSGEAGAAGQELRGSGTRER